jgi:hypothetical protein
MDPTVYVNTLYIRLYSPMIAISMDKTCNCLHS